MPENEMEPTRRAPVSAGELKVWLVEERTRKPVQGAQVQITYEGDPQSEVRNLTTDESGMTEFTALPAPDPAYSLTFSEEQPYACLLYTSPSPRDSR